jgi:hypothetical protein
MFRKPGDRFPRGFPSPPARDGGDFFAFHAFCAFLFPSRFACAARCHELRPGLQSRHRHLRLGAELKNRAPSGPRECPWDGVSAATTSADGPVAKL